LVSNLSLVMGVAGSGAPHETIVVAGLAGLVAGSLSMALGEYLSVQSARELFANELRIEAGQLAASPDAEVAELRGIYERKGVPPRMAAELADHMVRSDPVLALDTMAREELGFDPNELGGSAWVAAGTSLALFALGAVVPLLPFLVAGGQVALIAAARPQWRRPVRARRRDHPPDRDRPGPLRAAPARIRGLGSRHHLRHRGSRGCSTSQPGDGRCRVGRPAPGHPRCSLAPLADGPGIGRETAGRAKHVRHLVSLLWLIA